MVKPETAPTVAVKKTFRAFVPDQMLMLPPSLDEWLPEGHLARFVAELVDEALDLGPILAFCTEKRGFPPYDRRLMVRLLIYGYTTGVRSSRAIERKCTDDVAAHLRTVSELTPNSLAACPMLYDGTERTPGQAPTPTPGTVFRHGRPGARLPQASQHTGPAPGTGPGHGETGPNPQPAYYSTDMCVSFE